MLRSHLRSKLVLTAFCVAAATSLGCSRDHAIRPPVARTAAAGTLFSGTLQTSLSTLHSNAGDRFTVLVDSDVRSDDGKVVIRAGTLLVGRVIEADAGRKSHFEDGKRAARLRVAFDDPTLGFVEVGGFAHAGIAEHESVLIPSIGPRSAVGGGPRDEGGAADVPAGSQVFIPAGTRVQLMFVR